MAEITYVELDLDDIGYPDDEAEDPDDQDYLPWRDDNPQHRPIWRDQTGLWHCTCGRYSAYALRFLRGHVDRITASDTEEKNR